MRDAVVTWFPVLVWPMTAGLMVALLGCGFTLARDAWSSKTPHDIILVVAYALFMVPLLVLLCVAAYNISTH